MNTIYVLQDSASLAKTICESLSRLIPAANVFIGDHDMRRTLLNGCIAKHLFSTPNFLPLANTCAGEHPLWEPIRKGGQVVRCLSNFATRREWEATNLYNLTLRADGIQDHLSIEFGQRHNRITSIGIFRDRRGFSEPEIQLMTKLIPHFELAYRNARIAEEAGLFRDTRNNENSSLLLPVGLDGRVKEWNAEARSLLTRFFPTIKTAGRWEAPETLRRWLRKSAELITRGALEDRVDPLRIRSGNMLLEARLLRNRDLPGAWLLLNSVSPFTQSPGVALSRRETEVLQWVREGKTNDEISLILGCGTETVKTHLKRVFAKLGVDNRMAAVRRAFDTPCFR